MKFFKDLRSSNGGSLSNITLQDVVSAVSQLILDQEVEHFKVKLHALISSH